MHSTDTQKRFKVAAKEINFTPILDLFFIIQNFRKILKFKLVEIALQNYRLCLDAVHEINIKKPRRLF